jgi:hypothetical protein
MKDRIIIFLVAFVSILVGFMFYKIGGYDLIFGLNLQ